MRLALVLLVLLSGCAGSRPSTDGRLTAGTPEGLWLVTARIPSISSAGRTIEIPILMDMTPRGERVEGHARSAVLADLAGGRRNVVLARLLRPSAVRGGGVIHLTDGRASGGRLTGTLVLPRLAAPTLDATLVDGRFSGTLTWRGQPYGTVTGVPHAAGPDGRPAPLRDYVPLAQAIEDTLRARYYRPADLDTPLWQGFFADLRDRLGRVRDDADALLAVNALTGQLRTSHLVLDGRAAAEPLPPAQAPPMRPALVLSAPRPGVALITARAFPVRLTADSVRAVFEQIAASGAQSLVVDLRGNGGGWFVSLAIASHLLDTETPVGVELGRRWWTANASVPTAAQAAALPELSAYDLPGFYRTLRTVGALRASVRPALPRFGGRVVVLTDGRTASAAEPLADVLQATGRATVVGEPTAGAVLTSVRADLPGGWQLQFPEGTYVNAAGVELENRGVTPDVPVPRAEALERALVLLATSPG